MPKKTAKEDLLFLISSIIIVSLLLLTAFNLKMFGQNQRKVLGAQIAQEELEKEKTFWEKMVSENPTYIDGWLELSKILYLLGDKDYSMGAYNTARSINPNSKKLSQ